MAQESWLQREEELRAFWERERIFEQSVARDPAKGEYVFYDGPPTANAPPGMHHVEPQTYKDVIPRYKTMRGYRVRRKAGWDTHGLPVELQIEKKLGLKTKREIETYGIAAFNAACRDSVWEFKGAWEELKRRVGSWMDMRNPYVTYEMPFVESVWWFLQQAWERKLLVRDYKIVPWCPRCETPLSSHEVALGYQDDTEDPSVIVRFVLAPESAARLRVPEGTAFLVWTTTPWTLPGNGALAVHSDVEYAMVRLPSRHLERSEAESRDLVVLAKPLVSRVLGDDAVIERTISGRDLIGLRYVPLYARIDATGYPEAYQVLDAEFVSMADGTGIVHIAPAYGEDDFTFKRRGIPPTFSVDEKGIMADGLPGAGKFVKQADADIRTDLKQRGLLFRDETIRHTYPFCWRCSTPLLYFARASWYITMSKLRQEIQERNRTIHWFPEHIRDGRFGEWLRELKDWAITRERYWGAPIPIWECDRCQHREIIGSFTELIARAPKRNRFILMRHGEAESNRRVVINSKAETSAEYPLLSEGRRRVTKAAEQLKAAGITRIIASPFHRMRETAEIVSKAVGVPVTYDERLREFDIPDFDGKTVVEHRAVFPTTLDMFMKKVGQNETWGELAKRMLTTLKALDEQYEGETILVCSHGDPLFLLRWAFSGRTKEGIEEMPYPDFDNPQEFAFTGNLVNDRGELDVHRPFIDGMTWACAKGGCGGVMRRFLEVVDVWLESGCMPFAQHHYPFERGKTPGVDQQTPGVEERSLPYPADYISEAIDQTRGWFYTLLAVATVLGWEAPYRNVVVLGHLLDAKGQKMSKSKGNVVDPIQMIDRYGADVVRWYMLTVNQAWDPKLFNEVDLKTMSNKPFGTLRNLLSFWELHGGGAAPQWPANDFSPSSRGGARGGADAGVVLDTWLRARFASLHHDVTQHLDAYELTDAARAIGDAIDDCSTWWLRRSRERLKAGDSGAQQTFSAALRSLAILLAPFAPFHAEHVWQTMRARGKTPGVDQKTPGVEERASSVHLAMWEDEAPSTADDDAQLLQQMATVRHICSLGLEVRAVAGIPVRQPLAALRVPNVFSPSSRGGARGGVDAMSGALFQLVADEVNVREVTVDPSLRDTVSLDTVLTPTLKREGMARELTRAVNNLRKEMGLTPSDRIRVTYETDDAELSAAIEEHRTVIERTTVSSRWSMRGKTSGVDQKTPDVEERMRGTSKHTLTISGTPITLDIAQ